MKQTNLRSQNDGKDEGMSKSFIGLLIVIGSAILLIVLRMSGVV